MKDELLTIQEAAKFLDLSPSTLRRWEEKGFLKPHRTPGNQRRYSKTELQGMFQADDTREESQTVSAPVIARKNDEAIPTRIEIEQGIATLPSVARNDGVAQQPVPLPKRLDHRPMFMTLLGGILSGILVLFFIAGFGLFLPKVGHFGGENQASETQSSEEGRVLSSHDRLRAFQLEVNAPSVFGKKVIFLDSVDIEKSLAVKGESVLRGGIVTDDADIDAGAGTLTASNVIYEVFAGSNITITGGPQNPVISATGGVTSVQGEVGALSLTGGTGIGLDGLTITNSDTGSAQNIFKTFTIGSTNITAGSNNDTLKFAAGSGISLSGDAGSKTLTITSDAAGVLSGLTTNGVLYATSGTTATSTVAGAAGYILKATGAGTPPEWVAPGTVLGFVPFDFITSGTNTSAAMIVGSGASLRFTGSGTINASSLLGGTWVAPGMIGSTIANTGAFTSLTASTINGLSVTNTGLNTLTIATGKTFTANSSLTLAGTDGTTFTFPSASGTVVTLDATQTITNKTITAGSNTISGLTNANLSGAAAITNANLANSSVTVTAGTGLSGGGAVSLGGSIALANAGVTSAVAGTGIGISGGTGAVTFNNTGVISLSGTANQVNVSGGTGAVTLSLPQNIHTGASPTFAGMTLSALTTDGGLLYTNGTGTVAQTLAGSSNQCLLGGTNPAWGSCALGTNYWQLNGGALSPFSNTTDLLLGETATSSAKFGFLNVNSGTPTASIAGSLAGNALSLDGDGTIATTMNRSLIFNPNGGNVGIGTSSPGYKLEVQGTFRAGQDGGDNQAIIDSNGILNLNKASTSPQNQIVLSNGNGDIGSIVTDGTSLGFYTNGLEALLINQAGNVGIGNTSPVAKLDLQGAVTGKALAIFNETGDQDIFTASASGTTRFVIANAGNVGIGMTSPDDSLDVLGTSENVAQFKSSSPDTTITIGDNGSIQGEQYITYRSQDTGSNAWMAGMDDDDTFTWDYGTAGEILNPLMQLDQNGNLTLYQDALGGTDSSGITLNTTGNAAAGNQQSIFFSENGAIGARIDFRIDQQLRLGTEGSLPVEIFSNGVNNTRLTIEANGNISVNPLGNATDFQVQGDTDANALVVDGATSNVGIGTTSPTSKLHVQGAVTGKALSIFNETGDQDIFTASSSGTTRFTIANNGNLQVNSLANCDTIDGDANGVLSCGTDSGATATTLQSAYGNDSDGSDTIIALSATDDSLIFRNPASSGSDSTFLLNLDQLSTGAKDTLVINSAGADANFGLRINDDGTSSDSTPFVVTNTGAIGIGTTIPDQLLHLAKTDFTNPVTLKIQNTLGSQSGDAQLLLGTSSTLTTDSVGAALYADRTDVALGGDTDLQFRTSSGTTMNTNMTLKANGLLGIGTTDPTATLDVNGAASVSGSLSFRTGAGSIQTTANNTLSFGGNTTGNILFNSDGNDRVGIGTSAPGYKLDISAGTTGSLRLTNSNESPFAIMINNASFGSTNSTGFGLFQLNSGLGGIWNNNNQVLSLGTNGGLGVNTALGASILAGLDVRGNSGTTPIASFSGQTAFAGLVVDNKGSGDLFTASQSGATKFAILNNGNLFFQGATNNAFATTFQIADPTANRTVTIPNASGTVTLLTSGSSQNGISAFTQGGQTWAATATLGTQDANALDLITNNTTRLSIDATGKVGIGNTSPVGKLDVQGAVTGKALSIFNETGDQDIFTASASGTTRFTIANNGNVQINTLTGCDTVNTDGSGVLSCGTDADTTYIAGNDLDLAGTTFSLESILDFVSTINLTGTGTINGLDAIDATTETTLENAIDTLPNLASLTIGGDTITDFTGTGLAMSANSLTTTLGVAIDTSEITNNTITGADTADDTFDFVDFEDSLDLDASTSITADGTEVLSISNTGTGNSFLVEDVASDTSPFVIDASGDVGIGTGSPSVNLEVVGTALASTNFYSSQFNGDGGTTFMNGTSGVLNILNVANGNIAFSTNNIERMTVDNTGNVGIGNTSPVGRLDLQGAVTGKALSIFNETGDQDIFTASASGTPRFTITNNGNVQINNLTGCDTIDTDANGLLSCGTDAGATATTLQLAYDADADGSDALIALSTADDSLIFRNPATGGTDSTNLLSLDQLATGAKDALIINSAGADANFSFRVNDDGTTTDSTPFVITNTGSVGIGTTTPTAKLDVRGLSGTQPVASFSGQTSFATLVVDQSGTGDIFTASKSGATKFLIGNNGFVSIGTGIPQINPLYVAGNAINDNVVFADGAGSNNYLAFGTNRGGGGYNDIASVIGGGWGDLILQRGGGSVGIGTTSPTGTLEVANDGSSSTTYSTSYFDTNGSFFIGRRARGSVASPTVPLSGSTLVNLAGAGYTGSGFSDTVGGIVVSAAETFSGTNQGAQLRFYTTALGTTTTETRASITSEGDFVVGDDGTNTAANIGGTGILAYGAICADDSLDTADDCIDAARTAGTVYGIASSFTIDDIAENFPTLDSNLEAGDIVMLDYQPIPQGANDSYETEFVKKANAPYGSKLLGAISEKPGVLLGGHGQNNDPRSVKEVAVGLSGRIPVKVTTQNGSIEPGDLITASAVPGAGMKATQAGFVIGRALEMYDNPDSSAVGEIKVFLNSIWYDPSVTFTEDGNVAVDGEPMSEGALPVIASDSEAISSSGGLPRFSVARNDDNFDRSLFNDRVATSSSVLGLQDDVATLNSRVASLEAQMQLSTLNSQLSTFEASSSAELGLDKLDINDATVSNTLAVLGRTTLYDVGITGRVNIGLLSIEGLDDDGYAAINTSAGPLKLQSNGFNGIDILDGKLTIDTDGNLKTEGEITVKKLNIATEDVAGASLGEGILQAGETEVVIETTAVSSASAIFVTPKTTTSLPLSVTDQEPGGGFTVEIAAPASREIRFNWWVVN